MFSVGISPPLAAAALEAVRIMMEGNPKVQALHDNIRYFVEGAKRRGFDTCLAKKRPSSLYWWRGPRCVRAVHADAGAGRFCAAGRIPGCPQTAGAAAVLRDQRA
jgi:7-keto-8-aminopelargonate synthetase-like enzyme